MADARGVSVSVRLERRRGRGEDAVRHLVAPPDSLAYVRSDDRRPPMTPGRSFRHSERATDSLERLGPRPDTRPPAHRGIPRPGLEELGAGRPSTYASIMTTIQTGYVFEGLALVPTFTAFGRRAVEALRSSTMVPRRSPLDGRRGENPMALAFCRG
jgi:hypothetical protein